MNADLLREAVLEIRRDYSESWSVDLEASRFFLAVADCLATFIDGDWPYCDCGEEECLYGPCLAQRRALAVARAYLGVQP